MRVVAAVGGVGLLVGGTVALFADDRTAVAVLLLTVGLVLVGAAWLAPRIEVESLELLGAKVRVREVVRRTLEVADRTPPGSTGPDEAILRQRASTLRQLDRLYGL
jgi:hypothetical protein